ncbi:MAG: hypothetical protein ACLTDI_12640 [Acutalibacteraceae bacterium]
MERYGALPGRTYYAFCSFLSWGNCGPACTSKDPFSFTLEAEGKKSIKVDARVTDKAGRTDSIYYTIKKDGKPQQEERNLASVLADGSEKTITGVIGKPSSRMTAPTLLMYGL